MIKACLLPPLLLLLLLQNVAAQKQKAKRTSGNAYSIGSNQYLSTAQTDSLIYYTTASVFADYKVPDKQFRERFFVVKQPIAQFCKKVMADSLASIKKAAAGNRDEEKQLYVKYYKQAVKDACAASKIVQQQLRKIDCDYIQLYKSHVTILPDGKLQVHETIVVHNTDGSSYSSATDNDSGFSNYDIKRGIFRSFPTVYADEYKLNHEVGFDVKNVQLDGKEEKYTLKKSDNGYYLQIGNPNAYLPNGNFTYDIDYETDFQIKFLKDFDELYWNVTGNGWSFHIDAAICSIQLPANASILSNACYTGFQDEIKSQCEVVYNKEKDSLLVTFTTKLPLAPKQGLTIATSWNKGIVTPPGKWKIFMRMVKSNLIIAVMSAVIIILLLFNFIAWLLVGKDPSRGNVFPQFTPPPGLSPAAAGFLLGQGFNNELVAATIIDLAVRNKIKIDVGREGLLFKSNVYSISSPVKAGTNAPYEDFKDEVEDLIGSKIEKGTYNAALADLRNKIETYCKNYYLKSKIRGGFLAMNNVYMGVGNTLTFLSVVGLLVIVLPKAAKQNPWQVLYLAIGLIICIIIQKIYYRIIKAYTGEGRKTMDLIEGFRMYLLAADEHRINAMNPPKKNIELYEKYMPYAIALNCEIQWGKQFEDIITTASVTPSASGISSMHRSFNDRNDFGSSFSSGLSGSISSASSPPSSSSSGGGSSFSGGSSGGGGGGGGGGGW